MTTAPDATRRAVDRLPSAPIDGLARRCAASPARRRSLCVAVDNARHGHHERRPRRDAGSWHGRRSTARPPSTRSPARPTCVLRRVDSSGNVLVLDHAHDLTRGQSDAPSRRAPLTSVSCASASACVAVASDGTVFATGNASAATPTWSSTPLDPAGRRSTVSCSATGLCAIVDGHGQRVHERQPPPAGRRRGRSRRRRLDPARAQRPSPASPTGLCVAVDATAAPRSPGSCPAPAVDDRHGDAPPRRPTRRSRRPSTRATRRWQSCQFNYGTTTAYGASVPCSAMPAAAGGAQAVSAQIAGLTAGTTYHFQIAASSGVASATGADGTFTTPPPLKASPSLERHAGGRQHADLQAERDDPGRPDGRLRVAARHRGDPGRGGQHVPDRRRRRQPPPHAAR